MTAEGPAVSASSKDLILPNLLIGVAAGIFVLALLAVAPIRRRSRLAVAEAIAATTFVAVGAVVAAGSLSGYAAAIAGIFLVVGGIWVLAGLAVKRPFLSAPGYWLLPISLASVPFTMARFATAAEFRPLDLALTSIALGIGLSIASALAVATGARVMTRLRILWPRTLLVIAVGLVLFAISWTWTLLISLGATPFPVLLIVPFGVSGIGIAIGLWRWLEGDSVTAFVIGLCLPLAAGLAFIGLVFSVLTLMFTEFAPAPYIIESMAVIALGGITFGVLTVFPPRRKLEYPTPGRAMQHSWDAYRDEVPTSPLASPVGSSGTPPD
jgi:hypothetical protein